MMAVILSVPSPSCAIMTAAVSDSWTRHFASWLPRSNRPRGRRSRAGWFHNRPLASLTAAARRSSSPLPGLSVLHRWQPPTRLQTSKQNTSSNTGNAYRRGSAWSFEGRSLVAEGTHRSRPGALKSRPTALARTASAGALVLSPWRTRPRRSAILQSTSISPAPQPCPSTRTHCKRRRVVQSHRHPC
jgi:hypothetical protein